MREPRSGDFGSLVRRFSMACLMIGSVVLGACASADDDADEGEITYCEVEVVLADKCLRCHMPGGEQETHVYWTSYDEVVAHERGIEAAVSSGSMPIDGVDPLTAAEEDLILDWFEAGAPAGDCE